MEKQNQKEHDKELMKDLEVDKAGLKALRKKLAKVAPRSERGVETLFRLASRNHYTLNTMVDRKSNILITINAIVLSIIIGTVFSHLDEDPHLVIPVIMMIVTNLASIVFAIFATRPAQTHERTITTNKSVRENNLLFYGDYTHITEDDYVMGMNRLIDDGQELYNAISRDIYYTGKELQKKFGLLRLSYNVFMFGIILSVIGFVACHVFFGGTSFF